MARTSKTQELLNMDMDTFNRMSKDDLKKAVSILAREGNKRVKEFERSGEESPATRYIEQSGGKFTASGKDLNQLRAEFMREKDFIESKSGSVSKWHDVKERTMESLSDEGVEISENEFDTMWKAYERLKESNPEVANKEMKYLVLQEIANMATDRRRTPASIARSMEQKLSEIYEREERLNDDTSGVSRFIKIE